MSKIEGSTETVSSQPGIGGINPDSINDQCISGNCAGQSQRLDAHTVPGQAGEPGEGNYSPQAGALAGHENSLNAEVTPDQLRKSAASQQYSSR